VKVSVHSAKTQLSKLLDLVEDGEEVVIQRHGCPVARLVPVCRHRRAALGAMRGQFKMVEGWERPLTDEEAEAFWSGAEPAHLLDTSAPLWALASPERLSPRARRRVDTGDNVISVASEQRHFHVSPLFHSTPIGRNFDVAVSPRQAGDIAGSFERGERLAVA